MHNPSFNSKKFKGKEKKKKKELWSRTKACEGRLTFHPLLLLILLHHSKERIKEKEDIIIMMCKKKASSPPFGFVLLPFFLISSAEFHSAKEKESQSIPWEKFTYIIWKLPIALFDICIGTARANFAEYLVYYNHVPLRPKDRNSLNSLL